MSLPLREFTTFEYVLTGGLPRCGRPYIHSSHAKLVTRETQSIPCRMLKHLEEKFAAFPEAVDE